MSGLRKALSMSKLNVERPVRDDQSALAVLAAEVRALRALNGELARQLAALGRVEEALPIDEWMARATPHAMLDGWMVVRGYKAEAHLLSRIYRRRAGPARRSLGL
jgi:hypothetical protein